MFVFFQAEDGIRDLVRSRGLGDVYKRQMIHFVHSLSTLWLIFNCTMINKPILTNFFVKLLFFNFYLYKTCLLYTSDAADERSSVDLGGRRIIKKKKSKKKSDEGRNRNILCKEHKYKIKNEKR